MNSIWYSEGMEDGFAPGTHVGTAFNSDVSRVPAVWVSGV